MSAALKRRFNFETVRPIADLDAGDRAGPPAGAGRASSGSARPYAVDDAVLEALVTAFRDLRTGRSVEGWEVERPSTVMSTAEAVAVATSLGAGGGVLPRRPRRRSSLLPGHLLGVVRKDDPADRARLLGLLGRCGAAPRRGRRAACGGSCGSSVTSSTAEPSELAADRRSIGARLAGSRGAVPDRGAAPLARAGGGRARRCSTRSRPTLVLVELPEELRRVAAVARPTRRPSRRSRWPRPPTTAGGGLAFYPFADFSPELAAVRWAARNGVEVAPCDLPLADPGWAGARAAPARTRHRHAGRAALRAGQTGRADDDLWDRLVEAAAPGCTPEAVRRAALAVGWALRRDAATRRTGVSTRVDLRRGGARCGGGVSPTARPGRAGCAACVVGAFHAPGAARARRRPAPSPGRARAEPAPTARSTSLVPYAFELLDARSGYPAGIRDPGSGSRPCSSAAADPAAARRRLAVGYAVRVSVGLRAAGHPAGPAEAREAARLAIDLARLRGLPAPGRGELVEAMQTRARAGRGARPGPGRRRGDARGVRRQTGTGGSRRARRGRGSCRRCSRSCCKAAAARPRTPPRGRCGSTRCAPLGPRPRDPAAPARRLRGPYGGRAASPAASARRSPPCWDVALDRAGAGDDRGRRHARGHARPGRRGHAARWRRRAEVAAGGPTAGRGGRRARGRRGLRSAGA